MASTKNITMKEYNGVDYDTLYPKTIAEQVIGLESNYYKKNEILTDSTKKLYELGNEANPDDVFVDIANRFYLISSGKSMITITVKNTNGNPMPSVLINGISTQTEEPVYTNSQGVAQGFAKEGTVNYGISNYADIEDISGSLVTVAGGNYKATLTVKTRNYLKVLSSTNLRFSGNVQKVDVALGGGGAGGLDGSGGGRQSKGGNGGGMGEVSKKESIIPSLKTLYPVIIGSGGNKNNNGGSTSFMGISAAGGRTGQGGRGAYNTGGSSSYNGSAGESGKETLYDSFSTTFIYGGSGGGGGADYKNYSEKTGGDGGSPGGGNGGTVYLSASPKGSDGKNGLGGGGGGGSGGTDRDEYDQSSDGGKGGSGCVTIRIHLLHT